MGEFKFMVLLLYFLLQRRTNELKVKQGRPHVRDFIPFLHANLNLIKTLKYYHGSISKLSKLSYMFP